MPYDTDDQETVEVSGEVKAVTKAAILLDGEFGEKWVPKSLISGCAADDLGRGDDVEFQVPEWFAMKEGMVRAMAEGSPADDYRSHIATSFRGSVSTTRAGSTRLRGGWSS